MSKELLKCFRGKASKLVTLLVFSLSFLGVNAQESINAGGGNAPGSGGSVSFSIGQIFYHTFPAESGSVAEGVQQPFEIWVVTSIDNAIGISLNILAYPNPTNDFLILEVKDFDPTGLTYQLFDMSGKILNDELITDSTTKIDMSSLLPNIYFIRLIKNQQEVKTFKILKN
jgi:hypothetical protein